jgi:hypothetical protein
MDHTQLEELAKAIANHTVLDTLPYWLALLALVFLGVVIGSFLGSYFAKRGEVAAARADRTEILGRLRDTTAATEEIRSAISLTEWTERERRALRRVKLEEILLLAWKARGWLEEERNRLVFEEDKPENPSPQVAMMALGSLYFTELFTQLHAFDLACDTYHGALTSMAQDILVARISHTQDEIAQVQAANEIRGTAIERLGGVYEEMYRALSVLDSAAAALMATIIAPPG